MSNLKYDVKMEDFIGKHTGESNSTLDEISRIVNDNEGISEQGDNQDNSSKPSLDDSTSSITFWNIDKEPSIVKTTKTSEDNPMNFDPPSLDPDDTKRLTDELVRELNREEESGKDETKSDFEAPVANMESVFDKYIPKCTNGNVVVGLPVESDTDVKGVDKNIVTDKTADFSEIASDEHNDSDIVEINLNFDTLSDLGFVENGKGFSSGNVVMEHNQGHEMQQKENDIHSPIKNELLNVVEPKNNLASNALEINKTSTCESEFTDIEDSENIITKCLILSGISQPKHAVRSNKRPNQQISPERNLKRVKREHISDENESGRNNQLTEFNNISENTEFCPPVAIVFPLESDKEDPNLIRFESDQMDDYGKIKRTSCSSSQIIPSSSAAGCTVMYASGNPGMKHSLDNLHYTSTEQLDQKMNKMPNSNHVTCEKNNALYNELECAKNTLKNSNGGSWANFGFDFEFQDSKDMSIDVTPTINQLENYEEVFAGLLEEGKSTIKEMVSNQIHTQPLDKQSDIFKEHVIPPNVTYSATLKSVAPPLNNWTSPAYLDSITKSIESFKASNTMKPDAHFMTSRQHRPRYRQTADGNQAYEHRSNNNNDNQMRNENRNVFQTVSLHNDSNLLRKMISTPVTDSGDIYIGNSSHFDGAKKLSVTTHLPFMSSKTGTVNSENKSEDAVTSQSINASSDSSKSNILKAEQHNDLKGRTNAHFSDKPAFSEQVHARVTLHHTGAKEQLAQSSESADEATVSLRSQMTTNASTYAHGMLPLTVKTSNIPDRGVQDLLLQHSLRRKQIALDQQTESQIVPSSQLSGHYYPDVFTGRREISSSDYARLLQQKRGPSPYANIPVGSNPPFDYESIKHDHRSMGHVSQQIQNQKLLESQHTGYNLHQRAVGNPFDGLKSGGVPQLGRETNPYLPLNDRSKLVHNDMSSAMNRNMHPLLTGKDSHYANLAGHAGQNDYYTTPLRQSHQHANLPLHTTQYAHIPKRSVQYSNVPGKSTHYANVPVQSNPYANFPGQTVPYHRQTLAQGRPYDWSEISKHPDSQTPPFLSEYMRHHMNRGPSNQADGQTVSSITRANQHGAVETRTASVLTSQSDTSLQRSQQYTSAISEHPHNFGVR